MAPDHRARAAPLPHEQGRVAGVGDAGDGVSVTDGRDRGEAGTGVRGRKRERRGSGGAPSCGPGWHSAGRRSSNWI
jgi:hypothetical protein